VTATKRYKVESYDAYDAPDERTYLTHGYFDDADEAIACAETVIRRFIEPKIRSGVSPKEIYSQFRSFGDVPWILGDSDIPFDAFDYVKTLTGLETSED